MTVDENNSLAMVYGYRIGCERLEASEPKQVSLSDCWLSVLGKEGDEHSVTAPAGCMHANTCVRVLSVLNVLDSPAWQD